MAQMTRRRFVHQGLRATAFGGFTCVLPTVCVANPSDRVRVGLIGAGGRGVALLRLFCQQPDCQMIAVADVDATRRTKAAEIATAASPRAVAAHDDFRHILDDTSIDAVVLGTPDHWHAIPTIMACAAGKDVYVEKPDGHNMVEGQRMVQAMQKHGRIVQLGTQSRSSRHFATAMEFIGSGKLGRVLVAKSWESARQRPLGRPADSATPDGVDYDMWLGPAAARPFNPLRFHGSWRWFFDYGTGDLGNDGVHRLDVARWALATAVRAETGKSLSHLPRRCSAFGGKWYFDDAQEWPDTLQVDYEFTVEGAASRIVTYEMRIWAPYKYTGETEGVTLYGDRAYIILGNERWRAFTPDGEVIAEDQGDNGGREHVRNFLDCVKSRRAPHADLAKVGHPSSVMCHAANIAWRVDRSLLLDAGNEQFHDVEANALRSRTTYRRPWELPQV